MNNRTTIHCKLFIPASYYLALNTNGKALFDQDEYGHYFADFPAEVDNQRYLGECLVAFCEVSLILANPKYEITKDCDLHCELLKLGQDEKTYNLLLTIVYPNSANVFHDILVFQEKEQYLGFYSFELLGDQTLFSVE